jgi:hypothetical protein
VSEQESPAKNDLALVLNRLQGIMQQHAIAEAPMPTDGVPALTEVFTGDASLLRAVDIAQIPSLQNLVQNVQFVGEPVSDELANRVLQDMQPIIHKAIKQAVLEESVNMEKKLTLKLEAELVKLIHQQLTTTLNIE